MRMMINWISAVARLLKAVLREQALAERPAYTRLEQMAKRHMRSARCFMHHSALRFDCVARYTAPNTPCTDT